MSMQEKVLGNAIAATATGTGILMDISPFFPGTKVIAQIKCVDLTGTPKIEGSDDNSSWSDSFAPGAQTTTENVFTDEIVLKKYMRYDVASQSNGTVSFVLINT